MLRITPKNTILDRTKHSILDFPNAKIINPSLILSTDGKHSYWNCGYLDIS
jgi:hypothetical protein